MYSLYGSVLTFHNSSLNIGRSGQGHSSITSLLLSGSHLRGSWGYARGYTNQPLHHHSHFATKTKKMKNKNIAISLRFVIVLWPLCVEAYGGFLGYTTSFIAYFGIGNVGPGLKKKCKFYNFLRKFLAKLYENHEEKIKRKKGFLQLVWRIHAKMMRSLGLP